MKTFGQRIRELREAKDFSLRELAGKLQVSPPFLSDIELGRRNPSDKVLAQIAHFLSTSVEDLRKYDTRAPVQELKRLVSENPSFGIAFRMVIDKKVSAEELMKLADEKSQQPKKKHEDTTKK